MRTLLQSLFFVLHFITISLASPVQLENTTADILSEVKQIQPGKPFWLLVRLTLKTGWHTYWINPGDSGMETQIEWDLPPGFQASPIHWLPPQQIPFGRLVNFGYNNDAYHLIQITPPTDLGGQPQTLIAKTSWLVCQETCIPEEAELSITLPVHTGDGDAELSEHHALIHQLRGELAKEASKVGTIELQDKDVVLSIKELDLKGITVSSAFFFPEQKGIVKSAAPQNWKFSNDQGTGRLIHDFKDLPKTMTGVLQIHDENQKKFFNFQVTVHKAIPAPSSTSPLESLSLILLFAFLGGIILNAMPCVFPILSLKALSIAKKREKDHIRQQGIAYAVGVIVSFLLMAFVLIGLQQAGHTIGWGFQMQSPVFVGAMIYLMFVIGLSLSGYVYLPFMSSISSTGLPEKSLMDSFWVGVLAVLVATPCTAPFMGVAIGYALSQPVGVILLVFLALAIGFALPYFLISLFPGLFRLLPKPGAWMETLKEFFAFPMYATVVWLVWVLIQQSGDRGFIIIGSGLVLIRFSIWFYQKLQPRLGQGRFLLGFMLTLVNVLPLVFLHLPHEQRITVEKFSQSALDELRREGKPVFVNATAAWCITCKFNEISLKSEDVSKTMKQKGITFMEADWTNQDASITTYLKTFGRSGVPLYVFYPTKGEPIVLPQLLTESIIQETFAQQPDHHEVK